jgi:hypothetical protein
MNAWPSSSLPAPDEGVEEEFYKPQIRNEKEANYIQVRPRSTRGRRIFPLTWARMTEANYQTLESFFIANQGLVFTYTHPVTNVTHNCVFSADSVKAKWKAGWRTGIQCPIEEV